MQACLEPAPGAGLEAHAIAWRGARAERERMPIPLEKLEHRGHLDRGGCDIAKVCIPRQFDQPLFGAVWEALVLGQISAGSTPGQLPRPRSSALTRNRGLDSPRRKKRAAPLSRNTLIV